MNDLLTDSLSIPRGHSSRQDDIEMGTQRSGEIGLKYFFEKVKEVEEPHEKLYALLRKLRVKEVEEPHEKLYALLRKLRGAHEESKLVTRASDMKAIKHRMEKDVDEVGRIAHSIKSKIEELDRDNLANRRMPGCGQGSGVDRTRTVTTVALKKKFKDRMLEFQILKQNIQQEHREVVERRVFTVTGAKPNEEIIDKLIETGDSEQIFQKAILEQGRGQIVDTLAEIQERHDAVRDIEKKLMDLHQIFLDMAVLVVAQGDMLNNIESQVHCAVDHVRSGNTALQKAKSIQKSSRKWTCITMLIFLMIIAIVLISVLKPFHSRNGA